MFERLLRRPAGGADQRTDSVSMVRRSVHRVAARDLVGAVPKPFRTSTWLSAVGAAAIDSGVVVWPRVKMPPDSAVIIGKPDACSVEAIGRAAAPAGLADAIGDRRLPLRHLIGVREQLVRPRRAA